MKRIEEKMLTTIRCGYDWQENNTSVEHVGGEKVRIRLHGNLIAERDNVHGWRYSLCGWNTVTTRSRLNALGCKVTQKNSIPYRNGIEWWSDFE